MGRSPGHHIDPSVTVHVLLEEAIENRASGADILTCDPVDPEDEPALFLVDGFGSWFRCSILVLLWSRPMKPSCSPLRLMSRSTELCGACVSAKQHAAFKVPRKHYNSSRGSCVIHVSIH